MDTTHIASLITLATVIIGFGVQIYREGRTRRWVMEDRKMLEEKLLQTQEMIAENTDISTKVFEETTTVNQKLEKLGLSIKEKKKGPPRKSPHLNH